MAEQEYVLGLDLSLTSAGVAALEIVPTDRGACVEPALLRSVGEDGRKGDDYRKRMRRVRRQTADLRRVVEQQTGWRIKMAAIEGPIYGGEFLPSYFDRAILFGGVYAFLDAHNIPIAIIPPTTGHTFTTGKGSMPKDPKAFKPLILKSVRQLVPDTFVANHDIADALGMAFMAAMKLGYHLPFRPRLWQHSAVHRSTWPQVGDA